MGGRGEEGGGEKRSLPDSATCEMSTPCSAAMKPRMENTTKPAKKLVPLLISARTKASLQERRRREEGHDRYQEIPTSHENTTV